MSTDAAATATMHRKTSLSSRALLGDPDHQALKGDRRSSIAQCFRGRLLAVSVTMLVAGACVGMAQHCIGVSLQGAAGRRSVVCSQASIEMPVPGCAGSDPQTDGPNIETHT